MEREAEDDSILDHHPEEMMSFESDNESGTQEGTRATRSSQKTIAPKKGKGKGKVKRAAPPPEPTGSDVSAPKQRDLREVLDSSMKSKEKDTFSKSIRKDFKD